MLLGFLRTMRPHQWVKNLFVLAPLVFARELFDAPAALRALAAFAVFCALASSIYVINDIVDVDADRQHPVKKNRPIAAGRITVAQAKVGLGVLLALVLAGGLALGVPVLATLLGYLVLNLAYSFRLKKVAYVDVLCIAAGFELRVLAGSFAAQVPPSAYLLATMGLLACFLGMGKRMHEISALADGSRTTRRALRGYDPKLLVPLLYATGAATVVTYVVYTLDPHTAQAFGTPWLVASAPFALFSVLRFGKLVQATDAESPTDAMLRDGPFIANLGVWLVCVVALIYFT